MVKSIISLWTYLAKSQAVFIFLPIAACLISIALRNQTAFSALDFLALIGFLTIVFPAAGMNGTLGSLHQKELFVSMPISSLSLGIVQPVVWLTGYGAAISGTYYVVASTDERSSNVVFALFAAQAALFALTCFIINLFKNAAIGLSLALIYMIFGMFTTGTGQGPLYLFQWYRPRPFTAPDDLMLGQLVGTAVLLAANYIVIKYRSKFQLLPY
ncbi:hypothetical protein [Paenibacillus xylaniclasticus]|uniref:hypothetical protein n=1 Tax=Paenibacillus xylaniclasticus TaxID=588083 RepID=UPI000FD7BF05|nr:MULTISPECIES: hypothetical protein [Paenibacillus]GFN30877.1 hypothetical protein PCURB6_11370 [Paenibacillus curdlanolyticus]